MIERVELRGRRSIEMKKTGAEMSALRSLRPGGGRSLAKTAVAPVTRANTGSATHREERAGGGERPRFPGCDLAHAAGSIGREGDDGGPFRRERGAHHAHVALVASRSEAVVLTGDPDDLRALAARCRPTVVVRALE